MWASFAKGTPECRRHGSPPFYPLNQITSNTATSAKRTSFVTFLSNFNALTNIGKFPAMTTTD
jgi:hypothetical protein